MSMEHLETDFEKAQYLQSLLINLATGNGAENAEYQELRQYFLDSPSTKSLLPSWVRTNRDLSQFWQFIKFKFRTYEERRIFIWDEFAHLLDFLETGSKTPSDQTVSDVLKRFNAESVQIVWTKALDRRKSDPEGAITAARTLLETICKHILDEKGIEYTNRTDLPQLYHLVSIELSLSPCQYTEDIFKQILGGCSSIVNGLGTLRNRLGDAHGQGKKTVRPAARHAELAVNLAGSVALFLVETWESRNSNTS
ncbi:MAG: abortive infection family protein [Anaerolineae bacterium]|nr:abortive infection family protein [Anaerolineae bacterium]